jgi:hypothetical protein
MSFDGGSGVAAVEKVPHAEAA